MVVNGIKKSAASPSVKLSSSKSENSELKEITQELKTYTEEDHLKGKADEVCELYEEFKQGILGLDAEIQVEIKKLYIAFRKNKKTISDIEIQKSGLKIYINKKIGELNDPKHLMRDVSNLGTWGNGDYQTIVKDTENLEYIMSLVKQTL